MPDRPPRRGPSTTRLLVRRTERVTPHLIRVVAAPAEAAHFARFVTPHTDAYVKVVFRKPGVRYPEPFDMAAARAELPRDQWPALRTYTLREVRPDQGEIVIDFVYHGDVGLAGPWAATLAEGSEVLVAGPGGAYAPDPTADWHLMVGDDSALPAITAALARVPAGAPVLALIEVADADEEQPLPTSGRPRVRWLHRDRDESLVDVLRELTFPAGRVHAFVHGEAGAVKELRRHLLDERGLDIDQLSISGYWRRGFDDESYREAKAAERAAEQVPAG
ncbi:MAG TPA: siderophore-interacting protein [Pseudonocardia sp.]